MPPGRRPIKDVHQKRPPSRYQVTRSWLSGRDKVKKAALVKAQNPKPAEDRISFSGFESR